jgi:hypothetical protein
MLLASDRTDGRAAIMDCMQIRWHSRRTTTEAEARWRADVSAQLTLLVNAQAHLAELATAQLRDQRRQRPTRYAWFAATLLLLTSVLLIFSGILSGVLAATDASLASTLCRYA